MRLPGVAGIGRCIGRASVAAMGEEGDEKLAEYRASIDNIDAALIFLLAERFKITKRVGGYKAAVGLPPADPDREAAQVARFRDLARAANLDPDFSEKFLRFVVSEVIRHHESSAGAAASHESDTGAAEPGAGAGGGRR